MSRARIGWGVTVGVLVVSCLALAAVTLPPPARPKLTVWQQVQKRCRHLARERLAPYPWPVAPVHRPHPVRADFGDPRTVFTTPTSGSFSFHNGIDISAWPGNPVYPVLSGVVVRVTGDIVVVNTPGGRRFQYVHLKPSVVVNELVVASQTVIGTVRERWNHVHLTELRDDCTVNPLIRYHLTPYHDTTVPTVRTILFQSPSRAPLAPDALSGKVRILADAFDTPELQSPFPWGRLPVAPAHVAWSLETLGGLVIAHNTAADFRYGEPLRQDFCTVYAPGTEQNFAAVDGTFHYGKAGRYLFDLTPHLLDTSRLPEGRYRITVTAADTAGNRGTRSEIVELRKGPTTGRVAPETRCSGPTREITGARR